MGTPLPPLMTFLPGVYRWGSRVLIEIAYIALTQRLKQKKNLQPCGNKSLILLVHPARFERATYGFVVRHSIQLSYGRVKFLTVISQTKDDVNYFIA